MRTRPALLAAMLLASGINVAVAQAPPAAAEITGTVRMFKLTPVGDLEGFILNDGMEVHFRRICRSSSPPPCVRAIGWRCAAGNRRHPALSWARA
jgi:hypothetical protein